MPLNPPMRYSLNGLHLTEQFEQCRLVAYQDQGGIWTIAWGHTYRVYPGMTCTRMQADQWLLEDLVHATLTVNLLVNVVLTQDEFDALVDFVFNLGPEKFHGSTLLRLLNAGDYHGAAAQFDRWHFVAGKACAGLLRRRQIETREFEGELWRNQKPLSS